MNKENVNQVLDALAQRLSVPAAHLWSVLVRQAAVEFWTNVALAVVLSLAAVFVVRAALKEHAREKPWSEEGKEFVLTVAAIVVSIFAAISVTVAISSVGYLANPEYYALKQVLGALK